MQPAILARDRVGVGGPSPSAPRRERSRRPGWFQWQEIRCDAAYRICEAGMKIHFVLPQLMPFYGMEKAATQLMIGLQKSGAAVSGTVVSGDIPMPARGLDIDGLGIRKRGCASELQFHTSDGCSLAYPTTSTSSQAACGRPRRSGSPSREPAGRSFRGSTRSCPHDSNSILG